jgi:outer membrane protein OmpA-like peptidoglycan-associated protein
VYTGIREKPLSIMACRTSAPDVWTSRAWTSMRGIRTSHAEVFNTQAQDRRVSVQGHTDAIGSEAFNQQLSERRAETVASALEGAGVNPQQITARGFGKRYPVAPNTNPDGTDNPAGRARNRRVEVVIEN